MESGAIQNITLRRAWAVLSIVVVLAFGLSATVDVDFPLYYAAGTRALEGNLDIYPPELASGGSPTTTHYFRAAPAIAWLFAPFALLPLPAASFVFYLLKVAALVGMVLLVARASGLQGHRWAVGLTALAAAGGAVIEELRYGNAHALVFAGVVWALYLARQGRVLVSGTVIAVAVAIKLTPLLVVGYLAVTGRIKAAAAALAVVAILLLLPAAFMGFDANKRLLDGFVTSASQMGAQPRNHSLRGVILRYLTTAVPEAPEYPRAVLADLPVGQASLLWVVLAAALAITLIATIRHPVAAPEGNLLKDALVVTAILILSTHTQRIYFTTLFFPCCVLAAMLFRNPDGPARTLIRSALIITGIAGTLLPIILPGRRLALAYEMGSPYLFVALLLFAVLTLLIWRPASAHIRYTSATGRPTTLE